MKTEQKNKIMDYVERARSEFMEEVRSQVRYRVGGDLTIAEARLIQIECLAMDLGLIETGTI